MNCAVSHRPPRGGPDWIDSGLPRAEAKRRVALEFGGTTLREEVRDIWLNRWIRDFVHDLRFSARFILRSPSLTAAAVLSLAARNWSDDRPLFSNRSDRSARAPGGPPLAPRSIQLEWRTVGGDLRHRQLDVIPALPPTQKIGPAKSLFREILRVSHSLPICCGGDWDISKAKRHPFIICQSTFQKILKGKWSSGVVSCRNLAQTKTNDV